MNKTDKIRYYDSVAAERVQWRRKGLYFHEMLEKYVADIIPPGSSVMEIGCGIGDLLAALRPRKGVGIDFSPRMIDIARQRHPQLQFEVDDFESLRLEEKFDYVVTVQTIGHVDDIQGAFQQLHKVCTPETRLIVVYYNYLWEPVLKCAEFLGWRMKRPLQHWLPIDDISNMLHLNDFEVIKRGYRFLIPVYIPFVSAFCNRILAHLPVISKLCLNEIIVARLRGERKPSREVSCSVIIPCRNEKGNIEPAVRRIPSLGKHTELIFVEGHSVDGTYEECLRVKDLHEEKTIQVHRQDGVGKYDAVKKGFSHARNDVLMILDADLTVPPEDLGKFFDAISSGKGEFINGTRLIYQMEDQAMRFLNLLANKFFRLAFSFILEQRIGDTLCGTKVLWKKDYTRLLEAENFVSGIDPFGDFDLLFGATMLNLKIIDIPIKYRERTYGSTQIARFRHGLQLLKITLLSLIKVKFR